MLICIPVHHMRIAVILVLLVICRGVSAQVAQVHLITVHSLTRRIPRPIWGTLTRVLDSRESLLVAVIVVGHHARLEIQIVAKRLLTYLAGKLGLENNAKSNCHNQCTEMFLNNYSSTVIQSLMSPIIPSRNDSE